MILKFMPFFGKVSLGVFLPTRIIIWDFQNYKYGIEFLNIYYVFQSLIYIVFFYKKFMPSVRTVYGQQDICCLNKSWSQQL